MAVLQVDDDLLRQQQEAYKVEGVEDEDEQAGSQKLKKKRKQGAEEVTGLTRMH